MSIETIDQRIRNQAIRQLEGEIKEAAEPLKRFITDGCSHSIDVRGGYIPGKNNQENVFKVDAQLALRALQELALEMRRVEREETAISNFLNKVEALEGELEELRNSVQ